MSRRIASVILTALMLVSGQMAFACDIPSQITARFTAALSPIVKEVLGESFRDFHVILNDPKLPTGCYLDMKFVDDSPNGDFMKVCKMVGLGIIANNEMQQLNVQKVFLTIIDRKSNERATFNVSLPEDQTVSRNFLRLNEIDKIPEKEQSWMMLWVATWTFHKIDQTWTCADKIMLSQLLKSDNDKGGLTESASPPLRPITMGFFCLGAITEEYAVKIGVLISQKDYDALEVMVARGYAIPLKKGTIVYDIAPGEDSPVSIRKIRVKGSPDEIWISSRCVFGR